MTLEELKGFLKNLYDYFDKPRPKLSQAELWLPDVEKIPSAAIPFVLSQMKQNERPAVNLPRAMWGAYGEWKRSQNISTETCECHQGFWEVAFYLPADKTWSIYTISCGNCRSRGPREKFALLDRSYYEREPNRYMDYPPDWSLIYPDQPSLEFIKVKIQAHLATKKPKSESIAGVLIPKKKYQGNLTESELTAVRKALEENESLPF